MTAIGSSSSSLDDDCCVRTLCRAAAAAAEPPADALFGESIQAQRGLVWGRAVVANIVGQRDNDAVGLGLVDLVRGPHNKNSRRAMSRLLCLCVNALRIEQCVGTEIGTKVGTRVYLMGVVKRNVSIRECYVAAIEDAVERGTRRSCERDGV